MNGFQISYILSLDPYASRTFKGFAMSDAQSLPKRGDRGGFYILNTDTSKGPGEHWCVFYTDGGKGEFFDSFGLPPEYYNFNRLLYREKFKYIIYNDQQVQSITSLTCGHHCILYTLYRSRGYSMGDILALYDPLDTGKNDLMVARFIESMGVDI